MSLKRPSRQHANIIRSRARVGHNEDQLARALGVTRETMRGWAKIDKDFALALDKGAHPGKAALCLWYR